MTDNYPGAMSFAHCRKMLPVIFLKQFWSDRQLSWCNVFCTLQKNVARYFFKTILKWQTIILVICFLHTAEKCCLLFFPSTDNWACSILLKGIISVINPLFFSVILQKIVYNLSSLTDNWLKSIQRYYNWPFVFSLWHWKRHTETYYSHHSASYRVASTHHCHQWGPCCFKIRINAQFVLHW